VPLDCRLEALEMTKILLLYLLLGTSLPVSYYDNCARIE
jgi:hypothetical protein